MLQASRIMYLEYDMTGKIEASVKASSTQEISHSITLEDNRWCYFYFSGDFSGPGPGKAYYIFFVTYTYPTSLIQGILHPDALIFDSTYKFLFGSIIDTAVPEGTVDVLKVANVYSEFWTQLTELHVSK